jgi:hypothetical protein
LGFVAAILVLALLASASFASFGFQSHSFENAIVNEAGLPDMQAGSHPFAMTTSFKFNTRIGLGGEVIPDGDAKDIEVGLPAGLVGDPTATPKCTITQFNTRNPELSGGYSGAGCPNDTQVGVAAVELNTIEEGEPFTWYFGIYNLVAPPGIPAEFGLNPIGIPIILTPKVRTGGDYGVTSVSKNTNQSLRIFGIRASLWGVPADSSHDAVRGECMGIGGEPRGGSCPVESTHKPFLTLPTSCPPEPLTTFIRANSWQDPLQFVFEETFDHDGEGRPVLLAGCKRLDFSPTVSVSPDTHAAGSPAGVHVEVSLPQNDNPGGLAESDLKKAVVTLPAGMTVSPSAANGLQACTDTPEAATGTEPARPEGQIALHSAEPVRCPDASKVGTVEIETPLLEAPLEGSVYVATPNQNPFHTLLALYVVAEGSGVLIKLAGEVHADPKTGQLTTTFENTPEQPFSHLHFSFFGGPRAALMMPRRCGTYPVTGALTPWSGNLPAVFSEPVDVNSVCGGGFAPSFEAGTISNQAGGFSPFGFTLSRSGQEQGFSQLALRTPPGFAGMLSKIQLCEGQQAAEGTCPEASKIGHVIVGAGAGPHPIFLPEAGKPQDPVFLTGPYNGAPFGLSVVVPAEAGPFNLGRVVVRSAIRVDPRTAQITITSDPFPTILEGIPVDVRTIHVIADREGFTFNPTNCNPLKLEAAVLSDEGATAQVSSRFQAADCAALAFHPSFKTSTAAHPSHAKGASLNVKIAYPTGAQANIAAVKVSLPKQLPARLTTLQHACTEAAFAANPATCPPESNIGTVLATTPVLNVPLTGPAYLVSHGGAAFPDLVMVLQGQGITVELVGGTNIAKGVTTSTFSSVPDVPISTFELNLPQGSNSALTENLPKKSKGNFCSTKLVMPTVITAQSGARIKQSTKIAVTGCPKVGKTRARSKRG